MSSVRPRNWSPLANDPRTANDPQIVPQMIPGPEMIPRLYHKWSRTGNGRLAMKFGNVRTQKFEQWILNLCSRFFCDCETQKTVNIWIWFQKVNLVLKQSLESSGHARKKPQPIGYVRYINILTSIRAFRVKIAIFLIFLCLSIPKRDLDTKKTLPIIEVCPESLGVFWVSQ